MATRHGNNDLKIYKAPINKSIEILSNFMNIKNDPTV